MNQSSDNIKRFYPFLIAASAALFFLPFLGRVHLFDWDEINFAEAAREMIVTHQYSRVQINFQPFYEKPPLFIWMQAASMAVFRINEFAARFPNAVLGIITLLTFYFIGKKLRDEQFGLLWSLSYLGSLLPFFYFKSGIIDPAFNYFIFLAIYFLSLLIERKSRQHALMAGLFTGLAVLTKGPVALLIVVLTMSVFWITARFRKIISFKNIVLFSAAFIVVSFLWFGIDIIRNGNVFAREFIAYQINLLTTPMAGHGEPFYYYFIIVLFGCFPISVFAITRLADFSSPMPTETFEDNHQITKSSNLQIFQRLMQILFWTVMLLFTLVKSKIVHYTSLVYYPLSFLAATFIYDLINGRARLKKYLVVALVIIGAAVSLFMIALPFIAENKEIIIPYLKDPFAVACLNTQVHWNGMEWIIGAAYFILILVSIIIITKGNTLKGVILLFYSTAICLMVYLVIIVPKIEQYSQGPAINFYKSLSSENNYVTTIGFKSYAKYFYFQKLPGTRPEATNDDWLLNGNIDRPAWFVAKITSKDFFDSHPDCKLIKQEGGFLFYLRSPK